VDTRTATHLRNLDVLALGNARTATRGDCNGATELLNPSVEASHNLLMVCLKLRSSVLLSVHEALETLLLSLKRTRGMCSTKSKLTIKVSSGVGSRAEVVGRRHSAGYESYWQKNRKSVLTARP
jgi:hypothetical protein